MQPGRDILVSPSLLINKPAVVVINKATQLLLDVWREFKAIPCYLCQESRFRISRKVLLKH